MVRGIEQRVQALSGALAAPARRGDSAEKARRVELRRFVLISVNEHDFAYPSPRKLEGVMAKLQPLSKEHSLIKFLHNVDNAKTLTAFVQELADAIMDYQV